MTDVLQFDNVSLTLDGRAIVNNLNLTLQEGERAVIMGPSGSGKTSLLRMASGLIKPTEGHVIRRAKRVAMQFQEPRLLPNRTAAENVNVVLSDSHKTLETAKRWLTRVELADACDLYPHQLSGGMAQRVALARALAYEGDLLLLDEPFRGLDAELKDRIMSTVLTYAPHTAILLVTHDRDEAERFSERIISL